MFESWPVSRMRARHEALARDVMDIHAGGFSAVYGCREVRHGLVGKGRDPGEAGRDQVMDIMRGLGMRCLCSMVLRPVERLVFSPKER